MERITHRLGRILSDSSKEALREHLEQQRQERLENAGVWQAVASDISYDQGTGEAIFYHDDLGLDHLIIIPPPGEAGVKLRRSIRSLRSLARLGRYSKQLPEDEGVVEVTLEYSPENINFVFEHPQTERMGLIIKDIKKHAPGLVLGSQIRKIEDFLDRGRKVKEA